jgi:hypothetical protein
MCNPQPIPLPNSTTFCLDIPSICPLGQYKDGDFCEDCLPICQRCTTNTECTECLTGSNR